MGAAMSVLAAVTIAGAGGAQASAGEPVLIVARTTFDDQPDSFTSSLELCASGTVGDPDPFLQFLPRGGVYRGDKVFTCDDGQSGFTVRLKARFDGNGSTGTWVVRDSWGGLDGLAGSGSLVGVNPTDSSLDDVYTGTVR